MKKLQSFLTVAALFVLIGSQSIAAEFSAGADIMSRYVWRGRDYGNSPSIQPTVEYSTGNFSAGAWGAFSIDPDVYQELDLYLAYTFAETFTLGVTDYFFPVYQSNDPTFSHNYFEYDNETTGHILEANLIFEGTESIPITLAAHIAFYGADKNSDGDNNYSTYIEAGYAGKLKDTEYNVFLGITPAEGLYGSDFGVVNLGLTITKEIKFSDSFSMPVTSGVIFNPQDENSFLVFGITL